MCGIFGIASYGNMTYTKAKMFKKATRRLLEESQIRGSTASGLCVLTKDKAIVYKDKLPAKGLIRTPDYSKVIGYISHNKDFKAMIGHTRAPTKGDPRFNVNNHPIMTNRIIGVHNGHIVNDDYLFGQYGKRIERKGKVDSEVIFRLIDYHRSRGKSIERSIQDAHAKLNGSYTCAFIDKANPRYLSLFNKHCAGLALYIFDNMSTMVFASTEGIAKKALANNSAIDISLATCSMAIREAGVRIDLKTGRMRSFDLAKDGRGSHASAHQERNERGPYAHGCGIMGMWGGCGGQCHDCEYWDM